jgi:hypothetical protein
VPNPALQRTRMRVSQNAKSSAGTLANFDVAVTESDSMFMVLFRKCRCCESESNVPSTTSAPSWSYRVHANGAVEVVE